MGNGKLPDPDYSIQQTLHSKNLMTKEQWDAIPHEAQSIIEDAKTRDIPNLAPDEFNYSARDLMEKLQEAVRLLRTLATYLEELDEENVEAEGLIYDIHKFIRRS